MLKLALNKIRKFLPVAIPIFLFTLLFYLPELLDRNTLFNRGNDLDEFFWPIYYFVRNQIIVNHQIPLWNNLFFSGTPLLPDPQSPLFYFPNIILFFNNIDIGLFIILFTHSLLAGIGAYLLARYELKLSTKASFFASFLYIASPKIAGYLEAGHVGLVTSFSWLPFVFLASLLLARKPDIKKSIFLAFSLSMLFYTHLLIFAIALVSSSALFFFVVVTSKKNSLTGIVYAVFSLIFLFGFTAIALLPQLAWQSETTRSLLLNNPDVYPKWISIREFIQASISPWIVGHQFIWSLDSEKWIPLGIGVLFLSFIGFLNLKRNIKIAILIACLLVVLLSLNNISPVYNLLLKQNWYILFRVSTRFWFIPTLISIFLAAYGFEKLLKKIKLKKLALIFAFIAVAELLFMSWTRLLKPPSINPNLAPNEIYKFLSEDKDKFRVFCLNRCLSQKESAIYGLELADGYGTLQQKNYYDYSQQLAQSFWRNRYTLSIPPIEIFEFEKLQPHSPSLSPYNIKYIISNHFLADKNLKQVKKIGNYTIYKNTIFQPRSNYPILKYTPNLITIDTSSQKTNTILLSEVYSTDRHAYLNGKEEVPLTQTTEGLTKALIKSDTKFVDFIYLPKRFEIGKAITLITIILSILSFFKRSRVAKFLTPKTKSRIIKALKITSVGLIGVLVALILSEILLRSYYFASEKKFLGLTPARTTLKFYDNDIFGSALVPSQAGWFVPPTREYYTWVEVNPHGWPDIEHSYDKPSGVYRIVLLGDSFVENTQVPLEKRFFRQFQDYLDKNVKNKKIEVIAIGRGNTGTAQQYLILKNYALKYHPDMVVQMFLTANDVRNNSAVLQNDIYLPYFKINEKNELEEIPHQKRENRNNALVKEFFKQLRIIELLLSVRQRIRESKSNKALGGYPTEYHVYDPIYSKDYEDAWKVTKRLILESKKLTEVNNAKYILITLSNSEQVNTLVQNKLFETYPSAKNANLDFEKPDRILAQFCKQTNLKCFQMLPFFLDYVKKNPSNMTHNLYEGHWNQTGTDLAAQFLIQNFKNYFIIK